MKIQDEDELSLTPQKSGFQLLSVQGLYKEGQNGNNQGSGSSTEKGKSNGQTSRYLLKIVGVLLAILCIFLVLYLRQLNNLPSTSSIKSTINTSSLSKSPKPQAAPIKTQPSIQSSNQLINNHQPPHQNTQPPHISKDVIFTTNGSNKELQIVQKYFQNQYRFPKIIWLYTHHSLQAQRMLEQVLGHHVIALAQRGQWQVKVVNSKTAYDYISAELTDKITVAMRKKVFAERIDSFLKLSLLIENGGVMVDIAEVLLIQDLNWLEAYFTLNSDIKSVPQTEVLLFKEQTQLQKNGYHSFFIAATKGAQLLIDTLDAMCMIVQSGDTKYHEVRIDSHKTDDMNCIALRNFMRSVFKHFLLQKKQKWYKMRAIILPKESHICLEQLVEGLKKQKAQFEKICPQRKYLIYMPKQYYRKQLEDQMEKLIEQQKIQSQQDSHWSQIMNNSYNRQLYEPIQPRLVHYCILDVDPARTLKQIRYSYHRLKKQTYHNWTAVYFSETISDEYLEYKAKQNKIGYRLELALTTGSKGRNYQVGIIKLCPNKSFILLLGKQQRLAHNNSLQTLVSYIQPRDVLGSFVPLNHSGSTISIQHQYKNYTKMYYNGLEPKYQAINSILNHLRIFHSDCYKLIPQYELRTAKNQYFNDRYRFLQMFVSTVNISNLQCDTIQDKHVERIKWLVKSSRNIFDVPFRITMHEDVLIQTERYEEIDKEENKLHINKDSSYPMEASMNHLIQNGQTMKQFAIFNPGNEYQSYTERNKTQKIPKIIQQIWIGNQLPQAKKLLRQMNMKLYPDFKFKLWTNKDINRQNFPLTYDLIQTLLSVDKYVRYSRLPTIADVMRHELMYREGGLYLDTNAYLFNDVFYQWLSYRAVVANMSPFRNRWFLSMCFFANQPGYAGLLPIISAQNTNSYNIFLRNAMMIAGDFDFIKFVKGRQYDPDILQLSYESFYPLDYNLGQKGNPTLSMCVTDPKLLKEDDEVILHYGDKVMIKDCGKYYPLSFGKEVGAINGSSWMYGRW